MNQRNGLALLACALLGSAACAPASPNDGYAGRMANEHADHTPTANAASATEPRQDVVAEEVVYGEVNGQPVRGYLARPVGARDPLPGILVIHEWWGLNDNVRAMARRLAGEGYAALAVDLYGGEAATDPQAARQLMQTAMSNRSAGVENLRDAAAFLRARGIPRMGVIGWCFGGAWSLQSALFMPEQIDAAVVYYGQPETDPAALRALDAPLLGLFGEEDSGIPVDQVRKMEAALDSLDKDATIVVYPGAKHAFANPSGQAYNAEAAEDAWQRTVAFLARHLKP